MMIKPLCIDPAIYHAMRPDGEPMQVAYYRRVHYDPVDSNMSYKLEACRIHQWVSVKTDWNLKAMYVDAIPCWDSFEKMRKGDYDLIVTRTASAFGSHLTDALKRIESLPFPVYFEEYQLLSTTSAFKAILTLLIEDEKHLLEVTSV